MSNPIERRPWREFVNARLLWWVNRTLHLFGWVIIIQEEIDGTITDVYPARTKYRGFPEEAESEGFETLSKYLADNAQTLHEEACEE